MFSVMVMHIFSSMCGLNLRIKRKIVMRCYYTIDSLEQATRIYAQKYTEKFVLLYMVKKGQFRVNDLTP